MPRCPSCKGPVSAANPTFPFCAERCRLLDLGNWLDERYRVAPLDDADDASAALPDDDAGGESLPQ